MSHDSEFAPKPDRPKRAQAPAPIVELTPDALGQFAYLAHTIGMGSVGYAPGWKDLQADERVAWRAAADGVRMLVEMHRNG